MSAFTIWPEDVSWRPVSPKLLWLELISLAVAVLWIVVPSLVVWLFWRSWVPLTVGAIAVVVGVIRALLLPRVVKAWGYAERADDLLVRHGRVVRRLSIVPYGRMQFVDVTAGPLERAFGLATVQMHTAAAASNARVPGLDPQEAARLRDRLTALGHARAEGL
ncbi:PH domain-containing protein [Luedemannella helvata]|uniref:PH domain-containing protein n=1 Tax=Luedemannella helvata TaxID=349315 RepID=A0ABN2KPQ1_9ACTN